MLIETQCAVAISIIIYDNYYTTKRHPKTHLPEETLWVG